MANTKKLHFVCFFVLFWFLSYFFKLSLLVWLFRVFCFVLERESVCTLSWVCRKIERIWEELGKGKEYDKIYYMKKH